MNSKPAIRSAAPAITTSSPTSRFLLSGNSGYINGEVITIDGGEWLGAGQFNFLDRTTPEEWETIRASKGQ